ncbi:ribbon-helix-helix protein, CopG family [Bifidobacterium tibiigranuli]|jgi:hypothetical protein|nr:ribbon-helix-helix protein, CopG family [Bifidobacterium tibiigranuli]MCI1649323.1 ribbon-helix-helix protein, CopG family [Bifidobacterium tibiigranuli]MCI1674364.1 ribbon-helix-helix protein, CopG family [Bifidobacterium tibiigranuli]MCI1713296.1 ribbon-helix-helix protein, CopG family [Bifidobacterium tibiigranuli]MCI1833729.1 ribbon-helix-helix protein, CopG family [Bifidobacterium tibiigranuli]MCI2184653.1 ribbon-helix-helix protein, CopG family [Bifidobacterium tibiigranuli]
MTFTTENGVQITDEQFDQWAQQAENGHYPNRKGEIFIGKPPLSDEELTTVTFKAQPTIVEMLDARAKRQGVTRSELLRHAVERELATA